MTRTRTTPPRPLDIEALFPDLAAHRGTTTRLHPRPGTPTPYDSSVGGPLLWPADEPWPTCTQEHRRDKGRRIEDIREERRIHAAAHDRALTDAERDRLTALRRRHKIPDIGDTHPVPLLALAQLYTRDVPNLPAPPGRDLLQVLWCPFEAHGLPRTPAVHLRWRDSGATTDAVLTNPPLPPVVGYEGLVPEPCVLHPEPGVVEYEWPELLGEDLQSRIQEWEEGLWEEEEDGGESLGYDADFAVAAGWKVGGHAYWGVTGPHPMVCSCGTPMELLLAIRPSEHGGSRSWVPLEDEALAPTHVSVGRVGTLNLFVCPKDPTHGHRTSLQG
ncbi:hypothetical protein [Streptomyces aquilus]|uniref:hypothetical protein n=1 Tax=Streptomyces aquilus TaxID=2548456 RepID=UPI00367C5F8C